MRLRRLELVVIAITLAFLFFMGGFFTGRSRKPVSITASATQTEVSLSVEADTQQTAVPQQTSPQQPTQQNANEAQGGQASPIDVSAAPPSSTPTAAPQVVDTQRDSEGRININTASHTVLMELPGIGSTLATRIVDYRLQNGVFNSIDDLRNVSGIGERRYDAIKDFITIGTG